MDDNALTDRSTVRPTIIGIIALALTVSAAADVSSPAWRGQSGSIWLQWECYENSSMSLVESCNPYGQPELLALTNRRQATGGGLGAGSPASLILATIPTDPLQSAYMDFQVQVAWTANAPGVNLYVGETGSAVQGTLLQQVTFERLGESGISTQWHNSTYTFHLYPDTGSVIFQIEGGITVGAITIDARSVPEPATLALLVLGGAIVLVRGRKSPA
ncbi:MAG: PEP-CTERM sorting domain-containing protein [Planctomycetaceae bacterium]|nr:PEP-CTERM sorting domain-containing protein [Planctomycetaceae bacterium]